MPLISVLIPVFNGESVLSRAVGDALSQSISDIEVIVIDDASQDGSRAVAESLVQADSRVRVVSAAENGGPGVARALGLVQAVGQWVAILDADDGWEADRLDRLISVAEERGLDAVADNLALVDPGLGRSVGLAFPLAPGAVETITAERFLANSVPGGRINLGWMQPVVRRDFLLHHGITWRPVRHAEDMVLTAELLLAGGRLGLLGWPGYRYTQRRGTVSRRASAQSRTKRSAAEQQRAVALIRAHLGKARSPTLYRRVARMHSEIAVTTHILKARDAVLDKQWRQAGVTALMALRHPIALASCLAARYGPRSAKIV